MNSPLEIVNQRMRYYNEHALDKFLSLYAADVTVYTYPDKQLGQGLDHMRMLFSDMFEAGNVQVRIAMQLVSDSYVINEEYVSYGDRETRYVSIYEVRNGKIQSVRFVRDMMAAL